MAERHAVDADGIQATAGGRPLLALSGTWTLDPLLPVLEYWQELLHLDAGVRLAPYAQLFQQLLDPASLLRGNRSGGNVVCLRWEDLLPGHGDADGLLASRVDEIAASLAGFAHAVPCLVVCGPSVGDVPAYREATAALAARLAGTANLSVRDGGEAMARYRVAQVHDAASERFGHVPYTPEALAALGTTVARWYAAIVRPPVKVFAVDADRTLWSGVVGEAGVDGLRIDAGHAALQRALAGQEREGRLLCLLSKNEEADARAVFAGRADMALRWDDFAAHRVDWSPKPDNLREVVADLGLGLDGVVFLDDSPIECAGMRAQSPSTLTVRVPEDPARLPAFVDHLWLFDRQALTDEDHRRGAMYREGAARAASMREAGSLRAFLEGLELVVEILPPRRDELPRLAQLTQRTNQFNASLLRLREGEVEVSGDDALHRAVRVRDRFGDYGLVGQVRAKPVGGQLVVDVFLLSCRALGRGVEHRMLAAAGAHAQALGLGEVVLRFTPGERNTPVRRFLERLCGAPDADAAAFRIPAGRAAAIVFDPAEAGADPGRDDAGAGQARLPASVSARPGLDPGTVYERIAHELTTGDEIVRAMAACSRPRPELAGAHLAPAPGLEQEVAAIWSEVLRLDGVGAHDPFRELGGGSIQLVQVHRLLLERLGVDVDITTLFQHPTVASLAARLASTEAGPPGVDAAHRRGRSMREAQARLAAARRRPVADTRTRAGA